jgi:hypothetical protein
LVLLMRQDPRTTVLTNFRASLETVHALFGSFHIHCDKYINHLANNISLCISDISDHEIPKNWKYIYLCHKVLILNFHCSIYHCSSLFIVLLLLLF